MARLGGHFTPGWDHSFTSHQAGRILGGFVVSNYLGGSMTCHMASQDPRWCSRDLLWLVFHYTFVQCGCHKMITPLPSKTRDDVVALDLRAGWELEAVVKDAYAPGVHMLILTMTKDKCVWLKHQPTVWAPVNERVT